MIPKTLHAIWVGPPMPLVFAEFMAGWQRLHPDWEFTLWGQGQPLPPLVNQDLYDRAEEICPGLEGQLRSDIARLEILHRFGGVYIDTDFECLKPIDGLLEGVGCFVGRVTDRWLNNAIMGAAPGHPFIDRLLNGIPASIKRHPGKAPRVVSGPQYMTRIWQQHPEGVTVYPESYFYPYLWDELHRGRERFPDAYGCHHWGNRRRERGRTL